MVNLQAIQDKLNSDAGERQKFLADPVGYLKAEGLTLPAAAEKRLVAAIKGQTGAKAQSAVWALSVSADPGEK
jgi:hypothetical protein